MTGLPTVFTFQSPTTMTLRRILLLFALVGLSLTGCQKDSENSPSQSKTTLLRASAWHITGYTRSVNGGSASDYLSMVFPNTCERDDRYSFKSTGVVERNEYSNACGNSTPQSIVGTYAYTLSSDGTSLVMGSITFDVTRLTADVMELRHRYTSNGNNYIELIDYAN